MTSLKIRAYILGTKREIDGFEKSRQGSVISLQKAGVFRPEAHNVVDITISGLPHDSSVQEIMRYILRDNRPLAQHIIRLELDARHGRALLEVSDPLVAKRIFEMIDQQPLRPLEEDSCRMSYELGKQTPQASRSFISRLCGS
jgi:hypothetical protein